MAEKVMTELPSGIVLEIAHWAEEEKVDKSTLLTDIIEKGLDAWKMNKALDWYRTRKVTLWKAAEIAGVTLAEMPAELPKRGIVFQYDLEELREDLEYAHSE